MEIKEYQYVAIEQALHIAITFYAASMNIKHEEAGAFIGVLAHNATIDMPVDKFKEIVRDQLLAEAFSEPNLREQVSLTDDFIESEIKKVTAYHNQSTQRGFKPLVQKKRRRK